MSTKSTAARGDASARTLGAWSLAVLTSLALAGCGGGGGSDSSAQPPPQSNNPPNPPPASNAAPVANAGSPITVTLPTDNATLTGSATDDGLPAGSTLTYKWEFVSGPLGPNNSPGVVFGTPEAASTTARFVGGAGTYTLNFTASDGALTHTSPLTVTVATDPNLVYPAAPSAGASGWETITPAEAGMDETKLNEARDYSIAAGLGQPESGYVIRSGKLVYAWGDATQTYDLKSTTKSVGGLALLLALDENKLALTDTASSRLPVFGTDPLVDTTPAPPGSLANVTLLHLATHTGGFSKSDNPLSEPLQLSYAPGGTWSYSDQGLNWLADVLTQTYAQDLNDLLFSRVYSTLGIGPTDLTWRNNQYRSATLNGVARRELASGIHANVNALARVGLLMLRKGVWGSTPILSNAVVERAQTPPPEVANATIADPANYPGATTNYGLLWWTNRTGQLSGVPTDAFWAWGLHESFIIVIPSLDLVVVRAGDHGWHADNSAWNADYDVLAPFLTPIVQSIAP